MGSFFRSEEMSLALLFVQPEAAYSCIAELGEIGVVQFRDLNEDVSAFQRKFANDVLRCDEMERILRYIRGELRKDDLNVSECIISPQTPNPREIVELEARLEKAEADIRELTESAVNLKSAYLELTELRHVLDKTQIFLREQEESSSLTSDDSAGPGSLNFVAGVMNREKIPSFERMLWRISRGNVLLRQADIEEQLEDPTTGHILSKVVFAAFFQGEQLRVRVKKVCAGYRASLYTCPETNAERAEKLVDLRTRLEDLTIVLNQTKDHRQRVLSSVSKDLECWLVMVLKMKAIYHTLNLFNVDVTKKCLIGECWLPTADINTVRQALSNSSSASGSSIPSFLNVIDIDEKPPTYYRTNKFTNAFQNLIEAYGVASYREVNPALYTIITFPFLFAVMFGDTGHGIIMTAFGLYLVLNEKKLQAQKIDSEIWTIFFGGRYIILLMGLFSMYTGAIYNDIFSKSVNIFGSSWYVDYNASTVISNHDLQLDPMNKFIGEPYPFGLDPAWQVASNKILFLNSYKMKISIIFGVIHLIFGVCVAIPNHIYFRKYSRIFLEFLPQLIFLVNLFLWMVVMMIMKWVFFGPDKEAKYGSSCAPSVLILFINMMLFKSADPPEGCNEFLFDGQDIIQPILLFVALACVPVLLLGKPIYIKLTRKPPKTYTNGSVHTSEESVLHSQATKKAQTSDMHHNENEMPMSEIFIEQAIHSVEYVLSTISHTASYLRLWALSLAHAQLSEVLWNMILHIGLTGSDYISVGILFIAFAVWAFFTIAILVMMEGLSAFLHTLRLHWVEFMSKFYEGVGYPFLPFNFRTILNEESGKGE